MVLFIIILMKKNDSNSNSPSKNPSSKNTEETLVRSAIQGNEEAFINLYRQHVGPLYGFLYSKVNDTADAEDLTSETFFQALKDLPKFSFRSSFKNWLFGIAKNLLLAHYRQKYQKPLELDENMVGQEAPGLKENSEKDQLSRVATLQLEMILQKLPQRYRDVLSLRFLKGYSIIETADALGITEENAKVLQHRALKKANKLAISVTFASPQQ